MFSRLSKHDRVRGDWTRLGHDDPLWAVLVTDDGRHGGWRAEEFYATGRAEVDAVLAKAQALGARPGHTTALDFGCGVGRLSLALAAHVDRVIGVDVSPPMLEQARANDTTGRCTFVLNTGTDLSMIPDEHIDIAYSSLVLQHIPPPHNERYLEELLRVVRPGGLLVVQVATRPDRSVRGWVARFAPQPLMRFAQQRMLGYPAPMEMHALSPATIAAAARAGKADVIGAVDEPMYGGHWVYTRYYVVKGNHHLNSGGAEGP